MRHRLPLVAGAALLLAAAGGFSLLVGGDDTEKTAAGAPMARVAVPELAGVAARGRDLFDGACAVCHGENAAGRAGIAPPLVHVIYEPAHHADGAFLLAIARGVRQHHWSFGDMPAVPDVTQQDVAAIIAYVRALQRANGIY
ncbi:cytochrome c [Stappia sp. MMSF_3263]|uniref:c-type cytochrome n=1 Tax=Stappia sp. MMSF_3263 TaxID=3046693 RepID=UPI00273FCCFB|nr:cytochrome c [Stappia sp. MMSF_3263]